MAEMSVSGEPKKRFNPARFVYLNNKSEKCMDLPARLLWFYTDRKGWRLTLDGTRVIGVKKWVDNEYSSPESPNETEVVREEVVENYAIGNFSVLNSEGYRVTSVGASVKVENGDFMEELMERGFFLLLDFCGYSPYNISAEDWLALAREKQTPVSANISYEPPTEVEKQVYEPQVPAEPKAKAPAKEKKTKKQPAEDLVLSDLFASEPEVRQEEPQEPAAPHKEPEPEPLIPSEESRPDGQVPRGISESIIQMKDCSKEQLLQIFKMSLSREELDDLEDGGDPNVLNDQFDMLCIKVAGEPWASIEGNSATKELLVKELEKRLKQKQRLGGGKR